MNKLIPLLALALVAGGVSAPATADAHRYGHAVDRGDYRDNRADRRAHFRAERRADRRAERRAERRIERRAERRALMRAERRAERRAHLRAERRAERRALWRAERRAERRALLRAERRALRRADRYGRWHSFCYDAGIRAWRRAPNAFGYPYGYSCGLTTRHYYNDVAFFGGLDTFLAGAVTYAIVDDLLDD